MKSTRYIFLVLFMSLANIGLMAQRKNQITIPDIAANFGEAELVVNIDNTDEIVALQFDLSLPEGVVVETNSVRMTNRSNGHAVSVRSMSNDQGETFYRVFMFSSSNKALAGQSGEVIRIPITLPDTFEEGGSYPITISNAVLSTTTGENVLTKATAGFIGIQNLPDLTVSNITVDHDSFMPGDDIVVSWQVENVGHLATGDGWSEELSLVSEDGEARYYLTTVYYDEPLAMNASVSRQAEITIPNLLGVDGEARIEVQIVPNSQTGESTASLGNNTVLGEQLLNVGKKLYIELYPTTITENENEYVTLVLTRSGSWAEAETFSLTATSDSRVSVPGTIVIEEGQSSKYIYLDVANNDVFDENTALDFSAEGNGYEAVTAQLNIEDDDLPKLSITASDTDINEGETFQLTISTSRAFSNPISVALSCEESVRFTFPQEVVIPEGETSVTIDVVAVDNDEIERQESIAFRASADRHQPGECVVILNDNDMPTLTFTLSPESVSESAGATALFGIIKRTDNFDKRVVLKLSDDSNGLLTYSNEIVVMEKKQTEVQFNIGVADNDKVDGDRVVNVIASVYESSCDCSVTDDAKGTMTATVTIIDDDGPTLTIKPEGTAMLEGSEGNVFVISHNAQSNSDVTVRISSDKDDLLEYEHELTIPAGQTSANLLVNVKSNDQQDDSSVATFKVEANEYSMGTCWILITDQTLPDAIVSLTADKTEAEAEGAVLLRVEVKNVGNSTLPSNTPVEISFSGRKKTVNLTVGQSVPAGESAIIEYNYDLPAITGTYTFEATVNATEKVAELIYANNTSEPVSITLISPFSVTAKADKDIYQQTDNIVVSGKATGKGVNNAAVEVYFINEESRQTVTATTDTDGNYSVSWKPLDKQSGHFIVGACYPGSNVSEEMDAFDVYGIRARDNYATCELSLGETKNGSIFITNPGNLTQKGLQVTLKAQSENCVFTFNAPKTIGADKEIEIAYTVTANGVSEGTDWQKMPIEITTAEGSHLDYVIYYYVNFQKAKLSSNTTHISTTMTLSKPREYPVVIRNVGKGETGKITLALPAWIQTLTPREMASLAQGDSTTIMLRFVPTEEMKLNVRVEGQIGINCENGDGIAIVFDLTPVSDDKGTLKVDVKDEFTYYTDEAPHVSNALVQVKNPSTNEVVAEGKTAEDGTFSAELPEGYYSIKVEADKHDSYENTVIVDPGVNKEQEIWLSYQAVTYSWDVVETEIEDEYEIETIAKYETRVPKPVVVINLPDERPEPNSIIPITVTNKGLVHALDFSLNLSVNSDYTVEFLNDPRMETIEAQQSYVFYAKLKVAEDEVESGAKAAFAPRKAGSKRKCLSLGAVGRHKQDCEQYPDYEYSYAKKQYGDCSTGSGGSDTDGIGYWNNSGSNGPGYSPGGSGSSSYDALYNIINTNGTPAKYCDGTPVDDPNAPNDPVNLNKVPNGDPGKLPCDSKEDPVLVYKLIPMNGERYEMKGVAADGVSQVKVILDPEKSKIPFDECKKITDVSWELSRDLGQIEGNSINEAIYTAPDNFPGKLNYLESVKAIVNYTLASENGSRRCSESALIRIIRPPVVFVHGLGDSQKCWSDFYESLENNLYVNGINYRVDYKNTNTEAFVVNVPVVGKGIETAKRNALCNGFVANKCDIIGHSMGGILARLFIQDEGGADKVNRLITVNTPHAGSELGDAVMGHKFFMGVLARTFFSALNGDIKTNIDAIRDLAVESEAIDHLNWELYTKRPDVPVVAVATQKNAPMTVLAVDMLNRLDVLAGLIGTGGGPVGVAMALAVKYLSHLVLDDWTQVGIGDAVVSTESQVGGCQAYKIIGDGLLGDGPMHINSPKNNEVQEYLKMLLVEDKNSSYFSKGWFAATPRSFDHKLWQLGLVAGMPINFVSSLEKSAYLKKFKDCANKIGINPYTDNNLKAAEAIGVGIDVTGAMIKSSSFRKKAMSQNTKLHKAGAIEDGKGYIEIELLEVEGFSKPFIIAEFGEENVQFAEGYSCQLAVPSTFSGDAKLHIYQYNEEDSLVYFENYLYTIERPEATPVSIRAEEMCVNVGEEDVLRLLCSWDNGEKTYVTAESLSFENDGMAIYKDGYIRGKSVGYTPATVNFAGLTCDVGIHVFPSDDGNTDDSPSVCTTVTLSFKQKNVMTRQAFRGTLTINNGNETAALENVKLNLEVCDKDGQLATSHEFQIDGESLDGFEGELGLNSGWTLGAGKAGTATILFIPTKYAAQTEPEEYSFGGSFSYTDPSTGLTVTRALNPVTLTVNPSPNLEMTYFMQRDVFGDDPFTEEVEPMVPSEFALLVNNKGYGDAVNMSLTTQQPQIIENKKGLAIDFELISSQLNGGEKNLSLGGSMTSDFGTIPAHSQAYAQWWLQSSLLGHFIEYNVKATHLTSRENPDLSLVDTVTIHELIHGYTVSRDDGQPMRGFLVNDIKDANDLPDRVYFTDATQKEVTVNNNATIVKQSETEYLLTVSGSSSGWNYGSLLDPTQGKQVLSSIVRQSDGATLPVDNIWQTDRTLRDGKDWLYENRLHFIGEMSSSGESYLLTFEPRPDEYLCVEGYDGLPAEGDVAAEPVKVVTVKFNKAVDEGTFTPDDISLSCQGKSLDTSKLTITKVSDTEYEIDLSALTSEDGFYVLTVQTANISDAEGYAGESGKQAMWTQSGFLLGDVNYDLRINGMDIVELVELIMGGQFDRAGDLYPAGHPDGVLTGMDLVEEVELVMSQTSANPAPALAARIERLAMRSERNGVKSLGIQSDRPFILAQMTVELSEGMTLSSITSDRMHEVAYRQTGDNKYVVVCYSNRNETFETNGKALEFHCLGEGGIRVSDVLLIDADKQECLGTDAQSGDVTSIQEMEDERLKMNDSDIYDLSGRKIESSTFKAQRSKLQKGVYIINKRKVTIK